MKYKTKLVEIEAQEWLGGEEIIQWANGVSDGCGTSLHYYKHGKSEILEVWTLEGVMTATRGDFLICGLKGEFYFCKPEIFHMKYEVSTDCDYCSEDGGLHLMSCPRGYGREP
jgi:hypothetical protein